MRTAIIILWWGLPLLSLFIIITNDGFLVDICFIFIYKNKNIVFGEIWSPLTCYFVSVFFVAAERKVDLLKYNIIKLG